MGLFSSKYKTYVGTSISSFGDAKGFVSSKKKGVISGIARNESMLEHMLDYLINGSGFRAKKAYKYAENAYVFGRPNDTLFSLAAVTSSFNLGIQQYLTNTLGAQAVYYTKYGAPNYYHKLFKLMHTSYALNFTTKELASLSTSKGFKVTLHELCLLINPTNEVEASNTFLPITYLACVTKTSTTVSRIGAEITYRWTSVGTLAYSDIASSSNLVSTTTTTYAGGAADYQTITDSATTSTTTDPTITNSTIAASPPAIYSAVEVQKRSVVTTTKTTRTVKTYTAVGTSLKTETYTLTDTVDNYTIKTTTPRQETVTVTSALGFTDAELQKVYNMAAYRDIAGNQAFLDYEVGAGVQQLDNLLTTGYTVPGEYLPRLYFRWNAVASNSDKTSTEYLHSKKLAKKMGIAYDEAVDAIHKVDETRSAADLEQVKSVFMMYGVQADASSQIELEYLYKHFENWYGIIGGTTTTKTLSAFNADLKTSELFEHVLVIEDKRFKITLGMQGVYKRVVTGNMGVIGTYGTARGNLFISTEVAAGSSNGGDNNWFAYTTYDKYPWHVYRYQDTATTYIEYQVVGLETKYYVTADHSTASGWTDDVNDAKDVLYVPVKYSIVQAMNVFDQEELMYKSMHIVANSLVVQKIKWYQTGLWKAIFIVIALVALFYGIKEGFQFLYALSAVAGVSMVWAMELVYAALTKLIIAYAATKLFVNIAGEELAFLAAIVMVAYGVGNNTFKMGMPFASDMLAFSNSVFKEIGAVYQDKIKGLIGEIELFQKEAKEQMDALNVIKDSLDRPSALGKLYMDESAEEYYAKSHAGNIGTRVYDLQTNYVDLALKLPRTFNNLAV